MPSLKTLGAATLLALNQAASASALKCEGSCLKEASKYDSPKMVSTSLRI